VRIEWEDVLPDGTAYRVVVPEAWNGVVLLDLDFIHPPYPAWDDTYAWIDEHGYAVAGTSRPGGTLSASVQAHRLRQVLHPFRKRAGVPEHVIAFGASDGGAAARAMEQELPYSIDGVLAMSTPGSGRVSLMNQALDAAFAAKALLAPGDDALVLAGLPPGLEPVTDRWAAVLDAAQQQPSGQARIALAAAITQLPCWGLDEAAAGPPAASDAAAVQEGWFRQLRYLCATGPHLAIRQMMESLAGSPSWNAGVDFGALLAALAPQAAAVVRTLYDRAGLDLDTDLALVSEYPRVEPDPAGVEYARESAFDDTLVRPLLFMTKTGDPLSPASNSGPLEAGAREAGAHGLLRMCYVQAPGHGPFSRAEIGAALTALTERIQDGTWPSTLPEMMNLRGRYLDPSAVRFTSHDPGPGYRPFYAYSDYPGQSRTRRVPGRYEGPFLTECRRPPRTHMRR
jgi:hypothetical protein